LTENPEKAKAKSNGRTSKESRISSSSKTPPKKKKTSVAVLQLEEMQPSWTLSKSERQIREFGEHLTTI
jgi:hypothetical protein